MSKPNEQCQLSLACFPALAYQEWLEGVAELGGFPMGEFVVEAPLVAPRA